MSACKNKRQLPICNIMVLALNDKIYHEIDAFISSAMHVSNVY